MSTARMDTLCYGDEDGRPTRYRRVSHITIMILPAVKAGECLLVDSKSCGHFLGALLLCTQGKAIIVQRDV